MYKAMSHNYRSDKVFVRNMLDTRATCNVISFHTLSLLIQGFVVSFALIFVSLSLAFPG